MTITSPVTLTIAFIGDGTTTTLITPLAPLFVAQGFPGTTMPLRLVSIAMSDASPVTGAFNGQTLVSTFGTAPADLAQLRINVTIGV